MYGRTRCLVCAVIAVAFAASLVPAVVAAQDAAAPAPAPAAYKLKPISLDVQEAEIGTVLRSLAGFSGTNIVASPRVTGKVTVKLEDVPWIEALGVILKSHSFDYIEESGIYRIDTAADLREEKLAVERSRKQVEDLAALHLGIVTLYYANADEVKTALEKMLTERGDIDVDVRTNSILINDIPERVAMITGMAQRLDSETPQVEINARLVDLDTRASRELGFSWSVSNFMSPGNNLAGDLAINNPVQNPAGALKVATVQNWGELMLKVEALEQSNKARLISNPVITTTDNREASILVGQKIPLIVSDEAGNAITQLTTIGILLRVTPHINKDNNITLDIHNEVSDLSSQATVQGGVIINTSESDTRVLVEDGQTAVIGGLIRKVESKLESGIPVLKDVPLLGALFRHNTDVLASRELVVFVTPRIVTDNYLKRAKLTDEVEVIYSPEGMTVYK
ncbi:MAG: type IV pilus secretin PilQ [Krumholzibacteria bacterium]|nr:type IV pilus secretin PilQ [Candidatus Krumholzibacteria bacterium]